MSMKEVMIEIINSALDGRAQKYQGLSKKEKAAICARELIKFLDWLEEKRAAA